MTFTTQDSTEPKVIILWQRSLLWDGGTQKWTNKETFEGGSDQSGHPFHPIIKTISNHDFISLLKFETIIAYFGTHYYLSYYRMTIATHQELSLEQTNDIDISRDVVSFQMINAYNKCNTKFHS